MSKSFGAQFEVGVRLLATHMPDSTTLIKPTLFHNIRVGVYLYESGYSDDIVLGGLLHDILEDTTVTKKELLKLFNEQVTGIVVANTKPESNPDDINKVALLVQQCIDFGDDALIVKIADVLDNYKYYTKIQAQHEQQRAGKYTDAILKLANQF